MTMLLNQAGPVLESEPNTIDPDAPGPGRVQMQDPEPPTVSFEAMLLNGCVKAQLHFLVPGDERAARLAAEYRRRLHDLVERRFEGIREGFTRSVVVRERAALITRRDDVVRELAAATDAVNQHQRTYLERVRTGGDFRAALADKDAAEVDRQRLTAAVAELNAAVNDATVAAAKQWRDVLTDALGRLQAEARVRQIVFLGELARMVSDLIPEGEVLRAASMLTVDALRTKWGQLPEVPEAAPST